MDFFEQQQHARRHTALMLVLFIAAVAAIVAMLDAVAVVVYAWITNAEATTLARLFADTPRPVYYVTTATVLGGIAFATGKRLWELSEGGVAVAEMVDARRVARDTHDPAERRLLNIVEEMALASGIAVPLVHVMDGQASINAFAAGYSPNEATVIVTRGALERLGRDELQGVIAHEFSHILNGDMRLNIRLLGVISGIVVIGAIGGYLMLPPQRDDPEARTVNTQIQVFVLGLALWLIGSVGVLAGRLIKAVISRQREFLADASAVQFTRNPDGIGGALFKISERGGVVAQMHAEELSHMCIAAPVNAYLELPWLHSHPPIEKRIERVLGPGAKYLLRDRARRRDEAANAARGTPVVAEFASPLLARAGAAAAAPAGAPGTIRTTSQAVVETVGKPTEGHVDFARRVLEQIPAPVRAATGSPEGAQAVLFALLLGDGEVRETQIDMLRRHAGDRAAAHAAEFAAALRSLDARVRMPLLALVVPTLKVLPEPERARMLATLQQLAQADHRITVAEFVLLTICRRHFGGQTRAPAVKHGTIAGVAPQVGLVLSLLAHSGGSGAPALYKGMATLGLAGGMLVERSALTVETVESALRELKLLAPLRKPLLIKACLEVAMADGRLTVAEGELIRAICAALDTPLPPILDTAPVAA